MTNKIISWNIRGIGDVDKRIVTDSVLSKWNPDIVLLQETKLEDMTEVIKKDIWSKSNVKFCFKPSVGTRGISIMCDGDKFELVDQLQGIFSLSCMFRCIANNFEFFVSSVYAPNDRKERRKLWRELGEVLGIWDIPGCLGGDWNVISTLQDKNRQGSVTQAMRNFNKFMSDFNLVDLPLCGAKYTWSNYQDPPTCTRIDRFLLNSKWDNYFPGTTQSVKPRPVSDHSPLLSSTEMGDSGPRPNKFEIMWLEDKELPKLMKEWWDNLTFTGNPGFIFCKKLMAIKEYLKRWNKDCFGRVDQVMQDLLVNIKNMDGKEAEGTTTEEDRILRVNLKSDYCKWALLEDKRKKQKAKDHWLQEGDKNTSYFHMIANGRRIHNNIGCLKLDGELTEDRGRIAQHLKDFYEELYKEEDHNRPFMEEVQFAILNREECQSLEAPITEVEIKAAIKEMARNRSPGPDGFQWSFT